MQIEAKNGPLTGAPMPGDRYAYAGHPVTSAVAYTMSQGNSNMVSPFSETPNFVAFNNKFLKAAILRAAEAIKKNPDKQVWSVEMRNGAITLYVGDYGNVKASVSLGAIIGKDAEKYDQELTNGLMADHNEVYRKRGLPEPYPQANVIQKVKSWWRK